MPKRQTPQFTHDNGSYAAFLQICTKILQLLTLYSAVSALHPRNITSRPYPRRIFRRGA